MAERVEILMAVYNGAQYLPEQLDSILAQTDEDWHLTVSDDGSDDGSAEIIGDYARRFPDKIAFCRPPRRFGGARDHFFWLMGRCDAGTMLFCDQDDAWYPDKVRRMREAMARAVAEFGADTPILVFSDQVPTDAGLKPLAPSLMRYQQQYFERFDYRSLLMQNVVTGGAMGVNRALARLGAPAGDARGIIMHDWWLAVVAARFGKIVYLDEPLGVYRQHGENAVGAKDVRSVGYIRSRARRMGEVRQLILNKKEQASVFAKRYDELLNDEDRSFLVGFCKSHSGFGFYLKYMNLLHGSIRKIGFTLLG